MFHTRFSPPRSAALKFNRPSLCQRQFKEECDIGNMIRRALMGDRSVFGQPKYLNVVNAPQDFFEASCRVAHARTIWEDLPEQVRITYGSPEALLADFDRVQRQKAQNKTVSIGTKLDKDGNPVSQSVTAKADAPSTGAACAENTRH